MLSLLTRKGHFTFIEGVGVSTVPSPNGSFWRSVDGSDGGTFTFKGLVWFRLPGKTPRGNQVTPGFEPLQVHNLPLSSMGKTPAFHVGKLGSSPSRGATKTTPPHKEKTPPPSPLKRTGGMSFKNNPYLGNKTRGVAV